MDLNQRIAQFEKMAHDDPLNDMAHFSLGGAYAQAGRQADAAREYLRCVEINPAMSKAWQLAGAALVAAGDRKRAGDVLTRGYKVAAERGDLMPRNAMGELLKQLDLPIPEVEAPAPAPTGGPAPDGSFVCRKTGRPGTKLPAPPFRGALGRWVHDHISAETWRAWIGQGTKVINELRLDLSKEKDQETYDQHMREFLGADEGLSQVNVEGRETAGSA